MGLNKRLIDQGGGGGVVGTDNFEPVIYTGNGSTQSITSLDFQPDLVWIKSRSNATNNEIHDSLRVEPSRLLPDTTLQELTSANGFVSLDSNGFSLDGAGGGGEVNASSRTYVAWCWKAGGNAVSGTSSHYTNCEISANPDAGFSIVNFTIPTGPVASTASYNHGLNAAPKLIITKPYTGYYGVSEWYSWAEPITTSNNILLDTANAAQSGAVFSSVDSSTVKYRFGSNNGGAASDVVTYNFTDIGGYQKIGSYTGTGSSLNTISVGFAPRFVLFKRTDSSGSWRMFDSTRGTDKSLRADLPDAEYDDTQNYVDFTSDGFEFNRTVTQENGDLNASGGTYIYLAIA